MNAEQAVEVWIRNLRQLNPSIIIDRKTRGAFMGGYRACMKEAEMRIKELEDELEEAMNKISTHEPREL